MLLPVTRRPGLLRITRIGARQAMRPTMAVIELLEPSRTEREGRKRQALSPWASADARNAQVPPGRVA